MERRKCRNRKRLVQRETPPPAPSASSSAPPPPGIELPGDVTANMWQVIDLYKADIITNTHEDYAALCRRVVDRSQGQLVDLTIKFVGDGELINYVADRSPNLKRLKIVSHNEMCGGPFSQAMKKFGQLEELHLTAPWISSHQIEAIGHSCPKLKSFSYNKRGSRWWLPADFGDDYDNFIVEAWYDNGYAEAIGKCMPNLHHLQLLAHEMVNHGLEAILNGCPRLKSLDIRQCSGLDLGGDLVKRCREQIKDLRLPNVS